MSLQMIGICPLLMAAGCSVKLMITDTIDVRLQRLDGELLMFMDVCGRLLGDIRA